MQTSRLEWRRGGRLKLDPSRRSTVGRPESKLVSPQKTTPLRYNISPLAFANFLGHHLASFFQIALQKLSIYLQKKGTNKFNFNFWPFSTVLKSSSFTFFSFRTWCGKFFSYKTVLLKKRKWNSKFSISAGWCVRSSLIFQPIAEYPERVLFRALQSDA